MATTSFAYCECTVLAFEGGKVNNPNDPAVNSGPAQATKWLQCAAFIACLRHLGITF